MTEHEYVYLCLKSANISNRSVFKFEEMLGDIRELNKISFEQLKALNIISEDVAIRFFECREYDKIEKIYETMYNKGINFVHIYDEHFPAKLRNIPDMPYALLYKSELPNDAPAVAIVGARGASEYGKMMAHKIASELAAHNINIISGMALGVDNCAHRGAISAGGKTFAVLACGVDICYPRSNIDTYMSILDNGGVISEYLPETPPVSHNFPIRNRLISGLADIVVLTEAKEKSGSLITVDQALEQSREVFAIPGRITDEVSKGCNLLIKQGANMLLDISELFEYLSVQYNTDFKKSLKFENLLARDEKIVYSVIDLYPKALSEILNTTGLEYAQVIRILFELSSRGIIKETTKNYYVKVL